MTTLNLFFRTTAAKTAALGLFSLVFSMGLLAQNQVMQQVKGGQPQLPDPQELCPDYRHAIEAFDEFVKGQMEIGRFPGLSLAVASRDGTTWKRNYGVADLANNKPMTSDTVIRIASVSKIVTGISVLQLVEKGLLDLDVDINCQKLPNSDESILPFELRNPFYADAPITPRMIIDHTTSIQDYTDLLDNLYWSDMELGEFIESYLSKDGQYYNRLKNFCAFKPGSRWWCYANTNAALAGYIVERITGMPFPESSRRTVLEPLGMVNSAWTQNSLPASGAKLQANLYDFANNTKQYLYRAPLTYPYYPAGGLLTNANELLNFFIMVANEGEFNGKRILGQALASQLGLGNDPVTFGTHGYLAFRYSPPKPGVLYHAGGSFGVTTYATVNLETGISYLALANGRIETDNTKSANAMGKILSCMMAHDDLNDDNKLVINMDELVENMVERLSFDIISPFGAGCYEVKTDSALIKPCP